MHSGRELAADLRIASPCTEDFFFPEQVIKKIDEPLAESPSPRTAGLNLSTVLSQGQVCTWQTEKELQ